MRQVYFAFGIHNHQPIGNFDFVFRESYEKSYRPFLDVLYRFPDIKIALHFSGILIDWLEQNEPGLLGMVREMVERGQLEIMTGGYYEPILSIIPESDRVGQIRKLSRKMVDLFGYQPTGLWLAERVWEPTLPGSLKKAGVNYTVTDDTHFKYAGLTEEQLTGYYITEDLGSAVAVFPISKRLRYTIPFEDPQATIDHIRKFATDQGDHLIVFADDGEKFGVWPNTYEHVYEHRWLERFFQTVSDNLDWIEMIHFSDALQKVGSRGKIYLPTASYAEMMHWALFPKTFQAFEEFEHYLQDRQVSEDTKIFVRGGFYRNFLAKYPEVNNMHKKMLRISDKLWALPQEKQKKARKAFDALWAGQCNCPYWHGVFGGLYLSHLRDAIYKELIAAESLADELAGVRFPRIEQRDLNVDGTDEVIIETDLMNAYLAPGSGGAMYELDFKPLQKNVLDTMTRRREGYHTKLSHAVVAGEHSSEDKTASIHDLVLAKEPDLASKLHVDFYNRHAWIDHFPSPGTTLKSFSESKYDEAGDFFNQPYRIVRQQTQKDHAQIKLMREGRVSYPDREIPMIVTKEFRLYQKSGEIRVDYRIENPGDIVPDLWFGVELNFGLQAGHADDRYYYLESGKPEDPYLDSTGEVPGVNAAGLRDEWRKLDIHIEWSKPADLWRFPIETISLSEGGFERVYQNSVVFPNWKFSLKESWKMTMVLKLTRLS